MQISAGESAPILWNRGVPALTVTAQLMRMTDDFYWDGTVWNAFPTSLPVSEFYSGIYRFICPDNILNGHYMLVMSDSLGGSNMTSIFAGATTFNENLNTCMVYGLVKTIQGEFVYDSKVMVTPVDVPLTGNTAISIKSVVVYTDENGRFEIQLVRGSQVYITIDEVAYRKRVLIPEQVSVEWEDLEVI